MKTPLPALLMALGCFALCLHAQTPALDPEPARLPPAPDAVVTAFLKAIPGQHVDQLRALLADTHNYHITQDSNPASPGIWVETWDAWLLWLTQVDQSVHTVDMHSLTMLSDDLASITLIGHTEGQRTDFRAVIILTRKQAAEWRILSWTQENTYQK